MKLRTPDPERRVPGPDCAPDAGRRSLLVGLPAAAAALALCPATALAASRQDFNSLGTWAAAPVPEAPGAANQINNQTVRQVVRVSMGGDSVSIKLSNRFGTSTLAIQAAYVGVRNVDGNIIAGSGGALRFSGQTSATLAAFGELRSDWLNFAVPSLAELAVDIYISANTSAGSSRLAVHNARPAGQVLSYLAAGNQTGVAAFPTVATRGAWYFLTGVDVSNARSPGAIGCIGDGVTDGTGSTAGGNERYTDFLARRLVQQTAMPGLGVLNLGIDGNRVRTGGVGDSALARYDRDIIVQTGLSRAVVLAGMQDLLGGLPASGVIEGHRQMIQRAHGRRIKVIGGTLPPFSAASAVIEDERQALNTWIRSSGAYDAVIDFDAALRDPGQPQALQPLYDSGDGLHPNSAGYAAMADAIDLTVFAGPRLRRS